MAYLQHRSVPYGPSHAEKPVVLGVKQQANAVPSQSASNGRPKPLINTFGRRQSPGRQRNGRDDSEVPGRVRVAVRLRPRNAQELKADADFGDFVELQPELKTLRLRKNNWDYDTFHFDEVLTETASQKRVYEVVAKPVVESVLEGYNGTVMSYGQTGTGKTFTLAKFGEGDAADRGIMARAMEDILANISPEKDSVSVSYLQLYMESVQDLLAPEKDNIVIVEDPRSGDISLPGATLVKVINQQSFIQLLKTGEANRFAANTRLNTESSRSHAILLVYVKKVIEAQQEKELDVLDENRIGMQLLKGQLINTIRRSKLLVIDLAGSERAYKSGCEGHMLEEAKFINLSLTALGKCINALAENSQHVPIRESKLTRLLRDSFGGSARTSLIITIGPSPRHRGETTSTIIFGQRAMKVENMIKLKEEFDYKSLCRSLENDVDILTAENERQARAVLETKEELERVLKEMAAENMKLENKHSEAIQMLEQEKICRESVEKELQESIHNLQVLKESTKQKEGPTILEHKLQEEMKQREKLELEVKELKQQLLHISCCKADERKKSLDKESNGRAHFQLSGPMNMQKNLKDNKNGQNTAIAKLFEQVSLSEILQFLESKDSSVQIYAVKIIANLAAEEANQGKIVESGGLSSLLMLLQCSQDETIRRVAAGAVANLAMNERNQELIMALGGVRLLARMADEAEDPQTMRMVAGAIANLCGNEKLQSKLQEEGGIRALLRMVRFQHQDVLAQVARGLANFAKCESHAATQGVKKGKSPLIEDGALPWIISNVHNDTSAIRRHTELSLCHLAQHEANEKDLIAGGALTELVHISKECSHTDICKLAKRIIRGSTAFQAELLHK